MDEDTVLDIIKSGSDGILQNKLWKVAEIDSRKCSRIVRKLLDKGLVTREKAVSGGSRTYLIRVVEDVEVPEVVEDTGGYLIANGLFSPCAGCRRECEPDFCELLTEWIFNLLVEESYDNI